MCIELWKSTKSEEAEDNLRARAERNVARMRDFRLHLIAFAVGTTVLTATWAVTQYLDADG